MGVLRFGGGGVACGGVTWIALTMSRFSTRRTMNAVGTRSISTSGPELWGFVLLGSDPHCKKWGSRSRTPTTPFNTSGRPQQNVKV